MVLDIYRSDFEQGTETRLCIRNRHSACITSHLKCHISKSITLNSRQPSSYAGPGHESFFKTAGVSVPFVLYPECNVWGSETPNFTCGIVHGFTWGRMRVIWGENYAWFRPTFIRGIGADYLRDCLLYKVVRRQEFWNAGKFLFL